MLRVLVTGAGGFLGGALLSALAESGYLVRGLYRKEIPLAVPPGIETIAGDVRHAQCVKEASIGCDAIIHLAGKAHALTDDAVSEQDYQAVNVDGTKYLLEGAVANGVRRFIFTSSVKVFGETTNGCVDERQPPNPQSPYACSKWDAEQLVASSAQANGLATVSLRLPLVYGPTHKGNLYRMIASIDKGTFPPLPPIDAVRSMLHVQNFIVAVRAILGANRVLKPMYVVTDAAPYSIADIYDRLREALGRPPTQWRVPLWGLSMAAKCGDVLQACLRKPMPLSSITLQKLIGPAWYSSCALMQDSGYQPLYTFESAVPELIEHYRRSLVPCGC